MVTIVATTIIVIAIVAVASGAIGGYFDKCIDYFATL
jgi:preprotein translocase subunit SecE